MFRYSVSLQTLAGLLFVPTLTVLAQDSFVVTNRLPEVSVTAARLPDDTIPISKYPGNVTVVTKEQIAASPAFSLPELLQQQVGISSLDTVGFGQFGNVSFRGYGEKSGALFLVDGVRMNDAGESSLPFLFNSIPLANIERIEIIRGGASTTYGEGAIGGVINIITKKGSAQPYNFSATGAGGNLGYYSGHAELTGTTNQFSYAFSGDRQEWSGWRPGSNYRGWTAIAKPSIDTSFGKFTFNYHHHDEHTENPSNLTQAQYDSNPRQLGATGPFIFESELNRYGLDYNKTLQNNWSVLATVSGQTYTTVSSSGFGVANTTQPNLSGTLQATHKSEIAKRENTLTIGSEATLQDYRLTSAFGISTVDYWSAGAFIQDSFDITEKLNLTLGTRYDYREWDVLAFVPGPFGYNFSQPKSASVWSPKAALNFQVADKTESWISLSQAYRLPSGNDISAVNLDPTFTSVLFFPNPNIKPIQSRTVEIGLRTDKWKWLGGSLAYYYSKVTDDIVFDPAAPPFGQNVNFDSTKQGVELSLRSRPCREAELFVNTAWSDSRLDGGPYDGNRLPLVPEWQVNGGVSFYPVKGLTWTIEGVWVTGQVAFNDLNNVLARNQYTVVNTKLSYTWKDYTVFGAINNLADRRYVLFPTSGGGVPAYNPAAGINFQLGATVKF